MSASVVPLIFSDLYNLYRRTLKVKEKSQSYNHTTRHCKHPLGKPLPKSVILTLIFDLFLLREVVSLAKRRFVIFGKSDFIEDGKSCCPLENNMFNFASGCI
jgi:hypothetical protein